MKNLPVGIQTFRDIVNEGFLYVDKTRDIYTLVNTGGKYFFLSRPRRFGKSLLISVLEEIFCGNKELFKGLYIYDKIEWEKYPTIRIDFSLISSDNSEELKSSLMAWIDEVAEKQGIILRKKLLTDKFTELISKLNERSGKKIVVLIDEYDKPIIDHITDVQTASNNRDVLRNFYKILKGCDEHLKFVFLTGVSKFSQTSVFSGLNNLYDITADGRFSTMLGIREDELRYYFKEHIKAMAETLNLGQDDLLSKIKHWYNGYSWDGKNFVYNPFSLMLAFSKMKITNYWFQTGTPTFLLKLLKEQEHDFKDFDNTEVIEDAFGSYDVESIDPIVLLFQTGYITIKNTKPIEEGIQLTLGYPNFEVKQSFLSYLMGYITSINASEVALTVRDLANTLRQGDIEDFITKLKTLIAGIPYTLLEDRESSYHLLCYVLGKLIGLNLAGEVITNRGRIDLVIEVSKKLYVIEFKYGQGKGLANKAIEQIKSKKYYEKYMDKLKDIYLVGIAFSRENIAYKIEKLLM